jgi:hypothetical protein
MSPILRRLALLHRWVLAWFMLSLGVAVAAPLVHPQSLELVCAGAGMAKVIVHDDDGAQEPGRMAMDCVLCAATGAPPPTLAVHVPRPLPLGHALRPIPSARIAAATRSPLPARGPPRRS